MSGYRRQPKVYKLVLEDEPGLEIYVRSTALGRILNLMDMIRPQDRVNFDAKDIGKLDELFELFASCLKEWNLEHEEPIEGSQETRWVPTPMTVEGVKKHDLDFILELVMAWMEAIVSISGPLKRRSSDGEQSPEVSIPMEPL